MLDRWATVGAERDRGRVPGVGLPAPGLPEVAAVHVVVPAHDEQTHLGHCLESLQQAATALRAARPGVRVGMSVVLDRCTDASADVVAAHGVDALLVDAACVGVARRAGVARAAAATADLPPASVLVANTDADCVVPRTWLCDHVALARDHHLVQGEVSPLDLSPDVLDAWSRRNPRGRGSLHGANLSFRLDAYTAVGGYPAVATQEDLLLVRALKAAGHRSVGGTLVLTSGRRHGRVEGGFAGYLRDLDHELRRPPRTERLMSTTQAPRAVGLVGGPVAPAGLDEMAAGAVDLAAHRPLDLAQVLAWTGTVAAGVPHPGSGRTRERWEWLATLGAVDLTLARVAEPHLDAVSILAEAGVSGSAGGVDPAATWGVWAAEGPDAGLTAVHGPGGWRLSGTKPWCSLAGAVSHALVTAWRDDGRRGLYAVDLGAPGIGVDAAGWQPHGLAEITTATVTMDDVPAREVGGAGWYLTRPGFAWGGIGVAAVWFGGAVGLARRMRSQAERREPDQVAQMHLGAVDAALSAAGAVLATTANAVDSPLTSTEAGVPPAQLAARARQVVADAAEQVMARTAHALGPGPLAHESEHGRRVADLGLYLRQHHGERDQAALGRLSLDGPSW